MRSQRIEATDAELLKLLRDGDRAALEAIYFRYADILFQFARKRLNDHDTAADLIQELFLKLWIKKESLFIKGELPAYLTYCLRNQIIDHYSHQQVKSRYVRSANKEEADHNTLDLISYNDTRKVLNNGIDALPEKMQQVFMLNKLEDRSIDEIAQEMDISRQTVKNQLGMAVKRLRVSLGSFLSLAFFFHFL